MLYDPWLYWASYGAILGYLLVYPVRLLWVLCRDPRSPRGADLLPLQIRRQADQCREAAADLLAAVDEMEPCRAPESTIGS